MFGEEITAFAELEAVGLHFFGSFSIQEEEAEALIESIDYVRRMKDNSLWLYHPWDGLRGEIMSANSRFWDYEITYGRCCFYFTDEELLLLRSGLVDALHENERMRNIEWSPVESSPDGRWKEEGF